MYVSQKSTPGSPCCHETLNMQFHSYQYFVKTYILEIIVSSAADNFYFFGRDYQKISFMSYPTYCALRLSFHGISHLLQPLLLFFICKKGKRFNQEDQNAWRRNASSSSFFVISKLASSFFCNKRTKRFDSSLNQGCQIFLGITYQMAQNISNGHKIYQMAENRQNGL
jgi:hypothetical protein